MFHKLNVISEGDNGFCKVTGLPVSYIVLISERPPGSYPFSDLIERGALRCNR